MAEFQVSARLSCAHMAKKFGRLAPSRSAVQKAVPRRPTANLVFVEILRGALN